MAVAHRDVFGLRGYGLNVHFSVSLGSRCISLMVLQAEDFIGGVEISTQLNNLISLTHQPTAFQFYLSVSGRFLLRFGGCRRLGGRRGETGVDLVAEAR